jgi:hypothetical protein
MHPTKLPFLWKALLVFGYPCPKVVKGKNEEKSLRYGILSIYVVRIQLAFLEFDIIGVGFIYIRALMFNLDLTRE